MDTLKKLFPFSFGIKTPKNLVITIIVYIIADFLCGLVIGILDDIPLLGFVFALLGTVLGLYFLVGIILALLDYFKVLKS